MFLALYVDDILLIGNDVELLNSVKNYLDSKFSMKDLGEVAYVLGIKIYRDRLRRLLALSQSTYLDKILKRSGMDTAKKGSLPVIKNKTLRKAHCPVTEQGKAEMTKHPYASAIGSIMYAMLCTRPCVALALSLTNRFQSNPGKEHWIVLKCILKHLKKTKEMVLVYDGSDEELGITSYVDATFNTYPDDSKSQTGYVFKVNEGAVCWRSGKQPIMVQSTMELEYIAASEAASEAV